MFVSEGPVLYLPPCIDLDCDPILLSLAYMLAGVQAVGQATLLKETAQLPIEQQRPCRLFVLEDVVHVF